VEVEPLRVPDPGTSVAVRAVVAASSADQARLHVVVEHEDGTSELEPRPQPAGSTKMLVAYWDPHRPGPFELGGHAHAGDERVPLPDQHGIVEEAGTERVPRDPVGLAPGSVLWTVALAGWALAARLVAGDRRG
jgi:hypothetical protein